MPSFKWYYWWGWGMESLGMVSDSSQHIKYYSPLDIAKRQRGAKAIHWDKLWQFDSTEDWNKLPTDQRERDR